MVEMSTADIKHDFDNLRSAIFLEETEDDWEKIAKAMQAFVNVAQDAGSESAPEVVNALRNFHRPIVRAMNSERTRLCGTALDLLSSVARGLEREFDHVMPLFMPPLLALCGRTNKVVINRVRTTILSIIESTQLPSSLPYFVQFVKDKAPTLRLVVAEGTLACLNSCNPPDLEKEARARDVETIIRGTVRDANPDVRKVSRKIFESYKILLPSRVESFTAPLSPTMKKYLDIKPTTIMTSKSTTHLRDQFKQGSKPSTSATSTKAQAPGHSRAASVSNVAASSAIQSKNLASKLTRVTRKDPIPERPLSAQDLQASRPILQSQRSHARSGSTAILVSAPGRAVESGSLAGPVRSQLNTLSQTAGLGVSEVVAAAPRRLQISESKSSTVTPLVAASSGPKRVPMPPPAPKKEQPAPRRPAPKVDNATSTTSTNSVMVPPPPPPSKKTNAVTTSTTAKERPTITKPPIPKFKPTANPTLAPPPSSATSTKPLAVNKKPVWGRAPAVTKPNAQKVPVKAVVRKPSSVTLKPPNGGITKRSVTPAMIALPPSPTPAGATTTAAKADESDTRESDPVDLPLSEVTVCTPDPEQTSSSLDGTPTHNSISPVDSRLSTPRTNEETGAVVVGYNSDTPEFRLSEPTEQIPCTPESNLLPNPAGLSAAELVAKTPISALLSSIERGFLYSPTTPLSPADSYLPGPNGMVTYSHETHAPRIEGPMQPFNYALHSTPKGAIFSNPTGLQQGTKLMCGSIGVVDMNEHDKLYRMTAGLALQDEANGMRDAFVELNN